LHTPTLTREQVEEGYRLILGRAPESDGVVNSQARAYDDVTSFWHSLLNSEEFAARRGLTDADQRTLVLEPIKHTYWRGQLPIQHEVSPEVMAALVKRIQEQWTKLGEEDPHWSVLTDDRFRAEKIDDEALAAFHETGADHARLVSLFEERTGVSASKGVCVELGCGVGRITRYLAETFDKVIGLDISPGNLAHCNAYLDQVGVTNVETRQISGLADFEALPEVDFFYSLIVLQHNSPPIQKAILDIILGKIKPGGGVLFQIPTDLINYKFDADAYLASQDEVMEIHALPRTAILGLMQKHGLVIRDIAPDGFIGLYGSETFYAVKP
jgi:SAM-dependent methyltransferase